MLPSLLLAICLVAPAHANDPPATHAFRVAAAQLAHTDALTGWKQGMRPTDDVYTWSTRWLQSARDAGQPKAAAEHLARMQALHDTVKAAVASGTRSPSDEHAAAYYVAEAHVWAQP